MSYTVNPRNKDLCDKENPPHPITSVKKLNSFQEVPIKKTVLGDSCQQYQPEEDVELESVGGRLMARKREMQRQTKQKGEFTLKPIQC